MHVRPFAPVQSEHGPSCAQLIRCFKVRDVPEESRYTFPDSPFQHELRCLELEVVSDHSWDSQN